MAPASRPSGRPSSRPDFEIAIVCALTIEADAVVSLFDDDWDEGDEADIAPYDKAHGDPNAYSAGRIGRHNVVVAHMPGMGKANAATVAANCRTSWQNIRLALVVGICGAVPFPPHSEIEIILGDVVISDGIVQYDLGRRLPEQFTRKDTLLDSFGRPNMEIRALLSKLKGVHDRRKLLAKMARHLTHLQKDSELKASYPGAQNDRLFDAKYRHVKDGEVCDKGGCSGELVRRTRLDQVIPPPAVHFGLVASGDTVMKYGEERDRIAAQENVIAFEMEGAGLWDTFPCVVVKGACDYADSHKMKEWQCYAAATAASCAKAFLEYWVPSSRGNSRPNMMPLHGQEADGVRRGSASDVPASPPRKPCHHLPLRKNRKFVGRTSVMKILQQKLFDDDDQASTCVAVVGLGGVGKTQVALQMAYWTLQNKPEWHVFWVPALSMASFEQACRAIAQTVGLEGADKGDAKEALQHYLESDASGCWLLIVDNADDEEVVEGRKQGQEQGIFDFLPRTDRCRILFTTRVQETAVRLAQSEVIDISQMEEQEAAELLGKSLINQSLLEDKKTVAKLLGLLANLPLAIAQAAAYLNVTKAPVAEYIRLLQNTEHDEVELLETEFADDTRYHPRQHKTSNAVARTWVVSFEQIRKNADAAMLLSFIAHVEPRAIPRSMLPAVGSEQKMTSAIGVLCGYSFLSTREDGRTYDMHRLVHVASRVWVSRQATAGEQKRVALRHLGRVFSTDDWDERERWRPFLPHVLKAIEVGGKGANWVEEECRLGYWAGRCLRVEGRSREAVKVLERVVAVQETTLAETHPDRLASQHVLASAYQADGRVKEAIVLLERVVAVHETTLAETHPSRLTSQHTLASAYQADGRVKEAIVLLERVVAVQKTTLAETHPSRLASQHELARAYQADGRVKEAIVLLEWVVAVHETTLAETHPDRLASQAVLARAYQADGRVKEAIVLLERVVAVQKTTLAETHPDRLASQAVLARAYQADGRVKEAIVLLERVVAVQETTLASTHPDRLASQYTLASAYQADGRVKEAIVLLERVVAVEETTLASTHPDRLASQAVLASAYQADGRVKEAIVLLERVVAVEETTLAETHPSRLASQHELARAYQADGRVKEAIVLLEWVVAVHETTLAETHPDRLASQAVLARAYQADGRVKEAIVLLERVVAVEETTLAETHPDQLASQAVLAGAYQADGRVKEAIVLLERVVAVQKTTLAETHPDRLASQYTLASAYQADGRVKEAIVLLERVVAVEETTLAETHPDRLASQAVLARAYQADGRVKEAIVLLERVVAVEETTLAETHPSRLVSQHELARAYQADGRVKEAIVLLERVVAVQETTLAETHPSRLASRRALARGYQAYGLVKKAVDLLEDVVKLQQTTLSEEHPSRLTSIHHLVSAYHAHGWIEEAIELFEQVVALRETSLAETHPDRLTSQHELARAYHADGQLERAAKLLEHVVALRQKTLSEDHPDRLASELLIDSFHSEQYSGN